MLDLGRRGVRHHPAAADPQLAARRRRHPPRARRRAAAETSARPTPRSPRTQPYPGAGLENTVWETGMRVVRDVVGTPIRPGDLEIGDLINAEPEIDLRGRRGRRAGARGRTPSRSPSRRARSSSSGWTPTTTSRPRAARTGPSTASSATPRSAPTWAARSRSTSARPTTCCARATSRRSTWPTPPRWSSARPPAPLPQLPLMVDDEGYLVAQSDFKEPVGPSFWERDSQASTSE